MCAQSEVSYDYFADCYTVAATREYAAGEQVYVSYGQQSNDSLMQYYGFCEVGGGQATATADDLWTSPPAATAPHLDELCS